ncbi:hypothetical protein ACFCY8_10365 [Streptomyces noursei]|uniref:hypothetical protein n=1 Tax=Streptomyces noursei TaxID=1971 RepID=UPI0035DDE746
MSKNPKTKAYRNGAAANGSDPLQRSTERRQRYYGLSTATACETGDQPFDDAHRGCFRRGR